ncbi:MAG: LysR family transcriptional regulator [Myxococcales bacterium]|nr:LysR family transcriptional regulator [Myxococcales bacterium]
MIQLHRLEGFYRVAVAGGYTRAARDFPYPISQPGVYQQVRKLEEELGVRLLERIGKDRVSLTPCGRTLYAFCAPFFEGLPTELRRVSAGAVAGVLRVEVGPLEIRHLVPPWIKRIRRRYPQLEVTLHEVDPPDPRRVLRGQADFVVDHIAEVPDGVDTRSIGEHRGFVIAPEHHPFARARRFRTELLGSTPLVAYTQGSSEDRLQQAALTMAGLSPRVSVRASSSDTLISLVAAGLGFSVIPWPSRRGPQHPGVTGRAVPGTAYRYPVSIAFRRRAQQDPLVERALACL